MVVNDFNNGLIIGLSLQGAIFKGGGFNDIIITAMECSATQLKVKYNDDTEWTTFNYFEDTEGVITFICNSNGAIVVLTPIEESIYVEVV